MQTALAQDLKLGLRVSTITIAQQASSYVSVYVGATQKKITR